MSSQWDNFLRNLGTWRGSFTSLGASGQELESTASILSLDQSVTEERLVHFRLRRFDDPSCAGEPLSDLQQDYRTLGRQVVFFPSGTFCKGSLQVAPGSAFGAEFGFIHGDRRHRLVQLHNDDGAFNKLVLIREFREGSAAVEQPPLTLSTLQGSWRGTMATITADWPEPDLGTCAFEISSAATGSLHINDQGSSYSPAQTSTQDLLTLMGDGGYHLTPATVSHRNPFRVEAGWMAEDDRLERLIRCYDQSGAWHSAIHMVASRI